MELLISVHNIPYFFLGWSGYISVALDAFLNNQREKEMQEFFMLIILFFMI